MPGSSSAKIALVTGASRGIGAAIAEKLAADGFIVVLVARAASDLKAVTTRIVESGGKADELVLDLNAYDAVEKIKEFLSAHYGRLDCLVANAGTARHGSFVDLNDDAWLDGFNLKFFAHVRLIRALWRMLGKSHGSLIIIAGIAARTPPAESAIGASVNAALLALTKSLAEVGLTNHVRVNAVNPGQIRTDRLAERLSHISSRENVDIAEAERRMLVKTRTIRIGETRDVANVVGFLASANASYLHGSIIDVDGGMTKGN